MDEDENIDDDDLEADEDLQKELSKLVEEEGVSMPIGLPSAPALVPTAAPGRPLPPPPIPPRRDISLDAPPSSQATKQTVETKVGHSITNNSNFQQHETVPRKNMEPVKPIENAASSSQAPKVEETPKEKIKKILVKRQVFLPF